jgi:hypothetical protein
MTTIAAVLCATSAMAAHDNFDRASLGKKWVVTSGSLTIVNDQMQGSSLSLGYYRKSASDTTVSTTVYDNIAVETEYGAVASGDIASGNNAFVKIQSQNGLGTFDTAGFYTGNNGGGLFFSLDSAVPSPATLTVSFCGTVATMTVRSSAGKQKYTYDYGTTFGTGGGLGTYGTVSLDDYKSKPGGCTDAADAIVVRKSNAKDLSK